MFTIFHARKDREPLNQVELSFFFRKIDEYIQTSRENIWLSVTDYRKLAWYWSPAMNDANGVMGAADPMHSAVYLMPYAHRHLAAEMRRRIGCGIIDEDWLGNLFPVVIHELRHVWQYKRSPLTYTILSIPIIREITLERDAWAHTPEMQPSAGPTHYP